MEFAAVVLSGGGGSRLGGVDKSALLYEGRPLLDHALVAVAAATDVVVVGPATDPSVAARFVRELPPGAGPAAGLLAGRDALGSLDDATSLVVLAVDMPQVSAATVDRILDAMGPHEGAFLVDGSGRRQLAGALRPAALDAHRPPPSGVPGLPMHRLLAPLDLVDVPAVGSEAHDIDTWADLDGPAAL
jgi:molybdopterin-guanine dinucleotide biosynthesis protein A